jgi:hypothetical protein
VTPLPLEIVDRIAGLLHDTGGRAFNNPTYSSCYKIYILLLNPLAEDIPVRLESHLQAEVDRQVDKCYETDESDTHTEPGLIAEVNQEEEDLFDDSKVLEYSNVHLNPWFYNHTATRLDLERLVKQFHKSWPRRCGVHFLLPAVHGESQSSSLEDYCIGSVYHGSGQTDFIWRNKIGPDSIRLMLYVSQDYQCSTFGARVLKSTMQRQRRQVPDSVNAVDVEILCRPELPCYCQGIRCTFWPPWAECFSLFCLTNDLSKEQLGNLQSEVDNDQISSKIRPWRDGNPNVPDGTIEDIWEMFCELGEEGYCCPPYFFVDKQYGIDQTVIVVHRDAVADWIRDEQTHSWDSVFDQLEKVDHVNLRGILYGRIKASEIVEVYFTLSVICPSKTFADCLEVPNQLHSYRRRSWGETETEPRIPDTMPIRLAEYFTSQMLAQLYLSWHI